MTNVTMITEELERGLRRVMVVSKLTERLNSRNNTKSVEGCNKMSQASAK